MKLSTKLALAASSILFAAVSFTGCSQTFGKDDFFGTWSTTYVYPSSSSDSNASQSYNSSNAGKTYNITWYFDGTSDNLLSGGNAKFYQVLENSSGTKSFWYGTYELTSDSSYSEGELEVTYLYGFNTSVVNSLGFDALIADVANGMSTYASQATTDYKTDDDSNEVVPLYTGHTCDIEKFSFELGDACASGYTSMTCTEKSWQYTESNTHNYCDWGVKSRSFSLVSDD